MSDNTITTFAARFRKVLIVSGPLFPTEVRIDAAKAALPYEKPRLAAVHTVVSQEALTSTVERDAEDVLNQIERYVEAASAKRNSEPS